MKRKLKRMLALLMTLVLILTVCPVDGYGADDGANVGSGQMQNPLYPDLPDEGMQISSVSVQSVLGGGEYVSEQKAVALMRDAMVDRETSFSINIYAPDGPPDIESELFPSTYAFDLAEGAYDGDYLRWSWKSVNWGYNRSGSYYSYTFTLTYYTDDRQEAALREAVDEALTQLGTADQTDYQKLCAIYDYICSQADYDYDALNRMENHTATKEDYLIYTAYGAMLRGKSVCQGYACLLYAMCRSAGISVRIIHNGSHAWNMAKIGSQWYNLDVTWDGQDGENRTNYFLKGSSNFSGHTPSADFRTDSFQTNYPISETDYTPANQDGCYPHTFDNGVIGVPSCTQTGTRIYTCTKCNFPKTVTVAKTGHRHQKYQKDATCTEAGGTYTQCIYCGETFEVASTPALGHKYTDTVVPATCSTGGYTIHNCVRCDNYYIDTETEALGHSWNTGITTTEATETSKGEITYTCTVCTATRTEPIPKKTITAGHTYNNGVVTKAATCTETGVRTYTCGCGASYTVTLPKTDHIWDSGKITTPATTASKGERTYTCTVCDATKTEPIALMHRLDEGTVITAATCSSTGLIRHTCTDEGCEYGYTEEIPVTQDGHRHKEQRQEATCTQKGYVNAVCEYCGDSYQVEVLPALEHDYKTTRKEPACTTSGEEVQTCTRCGDKQVKTLAATGHSYVKTLVDPTCTRVGYTTYTCRYCGDSYRTDEKTKLSHEYRKGTVPPTCTEQGYTEYTCIYCGDSYKTNPVSPTGHSYGSGKTEKYASSQKTGVTTYTCVHCGQKKQETTPRLSNPFSDVAGRFYYEPVLWAVNYGITKGVTATRFEPDMECTRAQVVTFLWRAAGEPEVTNRNCGFTDVNVGAFYYEAMLWAVEEGITKGVTESTFCPDDPCNRGQVVTFLWRAAGEPEATNRNCAFTDVNVGAFYYKAMLWAVEEGITIGVTESTFCPENPCTRGQVVTFLYRSRNILNT